MLWLALLLLLAAPSALADPPALPGPLPGHAPLPEAPHARAVFVNGVEVHGETLRGLDAVAGAPLPDGLFWYDPDSGLWGRWQGPPEGFFPPALELGAVSPKASGEGSGLWLNDREAHPEEVEALGLPAGRYRLDARGQVRDGADAAVGRHPTGSRARPPAADRAPRLRP